MNKLKTTMVSFALMLFANTVFAQSMDQGKKFMYYERFKSARDVFQKILEKEPANEEAVYYLGQAYMGLENLAAAKKLYLDKLAANPNSPLVLAGIGHLELHEGKKADARNHFETAISLSQGKRIDVLNAVGVANSDPDANNGDAAYAIEKLKQATGIKGFKDPEVWTNLGDAYRKFADGGNAITSYNSALALNPNYARAIYRSGRVYQTQGKAQEPLYLNYYNNAIAKDPAYAPVYSTLFNYYYNTDVTKSAMYLDKWLANSDDDPKACFYRASMKYAQGLFADAIAKSDECIAAEQPNPYPNIFGLKALAYNRLNDSVNAKNSYEEYFKRQLPEKIGGGDYAAYSMVLLKFPGNEDKVAGLVTKAVELDSIESNKASYLKTLAQAFDNQKRTKDAAIWYNKILAVKKNPSNVDIYNAGYAFFRAGEFDSSANVFRFYETKYPNDIFGYYMEAKALAGKDSSGALGLAVPAYEKAIAIGEAAPDKAKVLNQLSGAYKYFVEYYYNVKKDQATALSYLDKALLLEPGDAQLLANKEFISKNDPKAVKKPAPKPAGQKPPAKKPAPPKKK
ncbi:MAG: tetratricopeptide repeat protein [Ferruginibacter sp.]